MADPHLVAKIGAARPADKDPSSAAVLVLIDPPGCGRQRARRYAIHLQPSLFGGVDLVREWGRVDAMRRPRRLVTHHANQGEASVAAASVIARRIRRGYQPRSR